MKNHSGSRIGFRIFLIGFVLLIVHFSTDAVAGDAYFLSYNFRSVFYIEDEKSVDITFANDEDFDVTDFSVNIQICYQLTSVDWDIVFEWSQENLTVEANSTLDVTTAPVTWSPSLSGKYQLIVDTYSPVDINLSNNSLTKDFLVGDYQRITLKQFNFVNPYQVENSTFGAIGFKLPPVEELRFINVMAQKPLTTNHAWLVRNLPVLPFFDTHYLYYHFDYGQLGYSEGELIENLDLAVKEDPIELTAGFDVTGYVNFRVWNTDYNIPSDNEEKGDTVESILDELGDLPIPLWGDVFSIDYEYIGCEMPNIELDSANHGVTNDYAGDWNACGPAAVANSLQWLENTVEEIPETGTTHREKMEELSKLMERGNREGVTTEQIVKGKLAFIDKYKLPIHVKYQSWWHQEDSIPSPDTTYGHFAENRSDSLAIQQPPTWEFLKEEVKNGEDVEILFGWYDMDANRHGGHWVTASGISETNYAKGVYIKEDWDQSDSTRGTHERYLNWETSGKWGRLVGFDGPNNTCWVESVVSESYDPEITFEDQEDTTETSIAINEGNSISAFEVLNNAAPLGEDAIIRFILDKPAFVDIELYTLQGVKISEISSGYLTQGLYNKTVPGVTIKYPGSYYIILRKNEEVHMTQLVRF